MADLETVTTELFTLPYSQLREYVEKSRAGDKKSNCTTQFAVDSSSAKQNQQYDIQAIAAAACRHGFCLVCIIIRHGERLGYGLAVVEHLIEQAKQHGVKINPQCTIFYDVACRFRQYVAKHGNADAQSLQYALGRLHGPVHSLACQLENSGLYKAGAGRNWGEQLEPMWGGSCRGASLSKYATRIHFMLQFSRQLVRWNDDRLQALPRLLLNEARRTVAAQADADAKLPSLYADLWGALPEGAAADSKYAQAKGELENMLAARPSIVDDGIHPLDLEYAVALTRFLHEQSKVSGNISCLRFCIPHATSNSLFLFTIFWPLFFCG